MFIFFEHTADLGIRVEAATLEELFADAGRGLTAALVDDPATIYAEATEEITITGDDHEYLLFDWLRELLFRFEARRMLFAEFYVEVDAAGLTARIVGEPLDPARHPLAHEVKAITYHDLAVEQTATGWSAEVIVDI